MSACGDGSICGPIPALAGETRRSPLLSSEARAYPRARGGNFCMVASDRRTVGLSPRSRGKLSFVYAPRCLHGPIPALAGETWYGRQEQSLHRAYPRARGGNLSRSDTDNDFPGLSPRSRGKLVYVTPGERLAGPIPALAGETQHRSRLPYPIWAYPRARGGNAGQPGSQAASQGLSPRSRGKLLVENLQRKTIGPIPALAGETAGYDGVLYCLGAYPRARGGNGRQKTSLQQELGLSPRSRGKPCPVRVGALRVGPIPALAGET